MSEIELSYLEFTTKSGCEYLYDPATNRIFAAPEPFKKILRDYPGKDINEITSRYEKEYSKSCIEENYNLVRRYLSKEKAFINTKTEPEFDFSEAEYWNRTYRTGGFSYTFNVSEECNFRCKYCVYGGEYSNFREHNYKKMSRKTARKAVEYIFLQIINTKKLGHFPETVVLNFYGGEPLLNYDVVKYVVELVKRKYNSFNVIFAMTTNASLFTKNIVKFFVENSFNLLISLDGPKSEHDRNRRFKNNRGTHDVVYKNVVKLFKDYPDYYKKHVRFNAVYDYKTNFLELEEYFGNNEIDLSNIQFSVDSMDKTTYYGRYDKPCESQYKKNMDELFDSYYRLMTKKRSKFPMISKVLYENDILLMLLRVHNNDKSAYTSNCVPGKKLLIDTEGRFHICERMNDKYPLGDCWTGINVESIRDILKKYHEQVVLKQKCHLCKMRHFCKACFVAALSGDNFDISEYCESLEGKVVRSLSVYYSIFEENRELFVNDIKRYKDYPFISLL